MTNSDLSLLCVPCPFCKLRPFVGPANPETVGNAIGFVKCENDICVAQPTVTDGEAIADERGSLFYKLAAIARWNGALS